MIKYGDLVQYIKDNHINWNTDLFDVLRGFFNQYSLPSQLPSSQPIEQKIIFPKEEFQEPEGGEYTNQDLFNLFNS